MTQDKSFEDVFPSQFLGFVLKKLNLTQQKKHRKNKMALIETDRKTHKKQT